MLSFVTQNFHNESPRKVTTLRSKALVPAVTTTFRTLLIKEDLGRRTGGGSPIFWLNKHCGSGSRFGWRQEQFFKRLYLGSWGRLVFALNTRLLGLVTHNLTKTLYYWTAVKLINRVSRPVTPFPEPSLRAYRHQALRYTRPTTIIPFGVQHTTGKLLMIFAINLLTYQYYADRVDFKLYYNYLILPSAFRMHIFLREYFFRLTHY
jgi:hypothetical protein